MVTVRKDPHKWYVGILMWIGVIWGGYTGNVFPAFVGIAIALAYLIYYK